MWMCFMEYNDIQWCGRREVRGGYNSYNCMGKKVKSELCTTGWCLNHIFQIAPLKNADCHYRKKIKLRLCPQHSPAYNHFQKAIPMVNQDRKHYTPCFILQEEQHYYAENDRKLLSTHRHKLESQGSGTIMVAKHGRKKNYCSVCRVDYEDYLTHIEDISHRRELRANKFSKFIIETENKMIQARVNRPIVPLVETKLLDETNQPQKTTPHSIVIED